MQENGAILKSMQIAPQQNNTSTSPQKWDRLGRELLSMWQEAHGAPQGVFSVAAAQNGLMVLIENAFCQAELTLAQQSTDNLLEKYIDSLTRQILPMLTARAERATGRQIRATSITSNIEQNWLLIFLKFDAPA